MNVCSRSRRLFTASFSSSVSPPFLSPPFRCSWPLIFDSACLSNGPAQPSPARPPPLRFVILAAPSRGGLADRLLCRSPLRGLIDGCAPPRFSHRSHCFAKGGKSRSNIFHISSPGRRIDVDVCSIHPQKPGTLSEHVTSAAPRGCNSPLRRGGHVGGAFSHEGQRCNRACWAHRWEEPRAPLAFNARLFFDPIGQQFL